MERAALALGTLAIAVAVVAVVVATAGHEPARATGVNVPCPTDPPGPTKTPGPGPSKTPRPSTTPCKYTPTPSVTPVCVDPNPDGGGVMEFANIGMPNHYSTRAGELCPGDSDVWSASAAGVPVDQ